MSTAQDRYPHLVVWAAAEARRLRRTAAEPAQLGDHPAGTGPSFRNVGAGPLRPTSQVLASVPPVPRPPVPAPRPTAGVQPFGLESSHSDDHATLVVTGELDMDTAPSLEKAVARAQAQGPTTLVIDLSGVEFIDSCGLHQLVVALRRQREVGGEVVLRSPRPNTLRLLEMVGLTEVFKIV